MEKHAIEIIAGKRCGCCFIMGSGFLGQTAQLSISAIVSFIKKV